MYGNVLHRDKRVLGYRGRTYSMNFGEIKTNWVHSILLAGIIICHAIAFKMLLSVYTIPIGFNIDDQMSMTMTHYYWLSDVSFVEGLSRCFSSGDILYPPFFDFISIWGALLFTGTLTVSSLMVASFIFFVITVVCVYAIANKIFDRSTALLAAFLFSSFPVVMHCFRGYNIATALMAMVALGVYVLLLSEHFSKFWFSVAFGVVSGLGLLTKLPYGIYIFGACIPFFLSVMRDKDKVSRMRAVRNMIFSCCVMAFIAFPYYGKQLPDIVGSVIKHAFYCWPLADAPDSMLSIKNCTAYMWFFIGQNTFILFFCCVVASILLVWKRPKNSGVLLWWIGFSVFFLTCMVTKRDRYLIPCMPAIAIVLAAGITRYTYGIYRFFIMITIIAYGIGHFILQSSISLVPVPITRVLLSCHERVFNSETVVPLDCRCDFQEVFHYLQTFCDRNTRMVCLVKTRLVSRREFMVGYQLFMLPAKIMRLRGYDAEEMTDTMFFTSLRISDVFCFLSANDAGAWPGDDDFVWHTNYFEDTAQSDESWSQILHEQEGQFSLLRSFGINEKLTMHVWKRRNPVEEG